MAKGREPAPAVTLSDSVAAPGITSSFILPAEGPPKDEQSCWEELSRRAGSVLACMHLRADYDCCLCCTSAATRQQAPNDTDAWLANCILKESSERKCRAYQTRCSSK